MAKSWRAWTPAVVAVVVVAGAAVAIPVAANASIRLPHKSPAQLVEFVESAKVTAFSGEITETSDLGLPTLPAGASGGGSGSGGSDSDLASELALLTGTNSLRIYVDGPRNIRLQDLSSLAEKDVIRHDSDVWTYDSKDNTVEHATIPAAKHAGAMKAPHTSENATAMTPESIAQELIAQLKATSTVSVDDAVSVAGRTAYELVLTPKVSDTLIGAVTIAVDSNTGLPLQVQIDAAGQTDPAISIGFTSIDFSTPPASLFDYKVPAGATVKELSKPKNSRTTKTPTTKPDKADKPTSTVTGSGWDAVVTVTAKGSSSELAKLSQSPEFAELTTAVGDGRVLHTTLFNVLFTTDGRIVAGAVSIARLEAVAAQ